MLGILDSGRIGFEAICNVNFIFRSKDARFMSAGYQEMENFKESVEQQGHCDFNSFLNQSPVLGQSQDVQNVCAVAIGGTVLICLNVTAR